MPVTNTISVPLITSVNADSSVTDIAAALNIIPKNLIDNVPWATFPYQPDCAFVIAHNGSCLFLKFFVAEEAVLARFTKPNDLVYHDSCVEFFIAFDNAAEYYNLEFNCIGTCYVGYGTRKSGREEAPVWIVEKIKTNSFLYSDNGEIKWELTVVIPDEVFYRNNQHNLLSQPCKANFYKCGDDLPKPHYLSWCKIESENPDFQQLVQLLDHDLAQRDGEEHAFYAQYNKITLIQHAVVAYADDEPVGCGAFKAYSPEAVEIKRMFVQPAHRQRGVARAVLAELERWAGELGYPSCVLETGKRQPEAIALYQRYGYALTPNYGQYVGIENSVCMRKELVG
ncbi:MAG: GNAT family N-acetyltransferase [Hymenobacter sp.]|nr:MAG: GNAT family N-acetyltransferase [Hymenobacter sp.]